MPASPRPSLIHPTAVIDPSAELAEDVRVGPYAIVEAGSWIGAGCAVGPHAVIGRNVRLGRDNQISHHAVIGTESQDSKYRGEWTGLEVGDGNVFREFVTVNRATGEGKVTRIGSGCRLLAYSHVAHNSAIGDGAVLANCAQVGGEVVIEEAVILGGLVGVHQFCRVGAYAIVGACSKVTQDILPFVTADGHPARPHGLNLVGLKRHGFSEEVISTLKAAYHCLFRKGARLEEALETLSRDCERSPEIARIVEFIRSSQRKIARPRKRDHDLPDPV
jgi:UDP-N-acetylglucosamine acyltransferase